MPRKSHYVVRVLITECKITHIGSDVNNNFDRGKMVCGV